VIYLSGAVRPEYALRVPGSGRRFGQLCHARRWPLYEAVQSAECGVGFLFTPAMGNAPVPGVIWAADNGCFRHPEAFDLDAYRRWLDPRDRETCLFVTCPDYVGDWCSTLDRFEETAPILQADGWRVALVAQDGLECYADRMCWYDLDALFIGGSTEWKLSDDAAYCVDAARQYGCWAHMGRVNSGARVARAGDMLCDSVDGTYLAFTGPPGLEAVRRWVTPTGQGTLL
jgi:hypothetical protein